MDNIPKGRKITPAMKKKIKSTIKTHDFISRRYKIKWKKPSRELAGGDAWGLCEDNNAPEKTIHISPNLGEYDFLATCLDEAIHACNFSLDNDHVGEMSDSLAHFLWRIGFRIESDN